MSLKKLVEQVQSEKLLRVASPKACNMQQTGCDDATLCATVMQQVTFNPAKQGESRCNAVRNTPAISLKNLCNKSSPTDAYFVASEANQSNIIDLRTYLVKLCQRLPMPPEHLLRYYFTEDDLADIRGGRYTDIQALAEFIKTDPRFPFGVK